MPDDIATETPTEAPEQAQQPANDNAAAPAANDNAAPAITEAQVLELAEKYGPDKALQIIAKKIGWEVDGQSVSVADRKAFRDQQREAKAAWEARERQFAENWDKKLRDAQGEIDFGRAVKAAREQGDYDGIARAVGFKDWNELTEDHIKKLADPNHQRLTELEKRLQEKERAEQEQRQQWEQQQAQQQRAAQVQAYKGEMSAGMKQSENPVLRELADFPDVVNMLFAVQQANFDNASRRTVTLEQAINMPLPGGSQPIIGILKSWHAGLSKAFGGEAAPAAQAAKPKASGKTAPTPTPAPSANRAVKDYKEWEEMGARELEAAFRNEAQARAEERRKGVA